MQLSLAFSPCPNDTFIFDALVNKKIDTKGYSFNVLLEDVQTLNEWALQGKADISKISYALLPEILHEYIILQSGGALGNGVGPLLLAPPNININKINVDEYTILLPGKNTTANFLFSMAYPTANKKQFVAFNKIEELLLKETTNKLLGVIIHENRFTYAVKGLQKITDLGEYWESQTKCPIPLGGIAIKRTLPENVQQDMNDLIRESVEFAFKNYPQLAPYVKQHSQEMSEDVMRSHINLYVNDYSINLGLKGQNAINKMLNTLNYMTPNTIFVAAKQ